MKVSGSIKTRYLQVTTKYNIILKAINSGGHSFASKDTVSKLEQSFKTMGERMSKDPFYNLFIVSEI